ncbi:hypothetical protein JG687_00012850, partial [Phytophthora cactorum]
LWESSPIAKEWHESWEAFKDYLERYQEDTHQLFRLRSPTSVARRNAEIKDHAGGSSSETSDSGSMRIPQELKTFWVKYISTHGWQHKAYFGNSTECKADIKAAVTWNKEERKFMVRVTGSSTSHNHRVDRAVYENHPPVRRVENPVLLAFVDVMQSSGSKPKRIMEFLRERQKYIRSEMAKSKYGGPSSFDMDQVEDAVAMLRTAPTNEDYTKYLKYLYFLLDNAHLTSTDNIPEPKHPFLHYFMKNWDHQKERWAVYARSDVPHLGNHINNRLEASWGHIKEILKPEMPLDECVDELIFLQAVAEMDYSKKMTAVGYMRYLMQNLNNYHER